jgi:hypothetical protein
MAFPIQYGSVNSNLEKPMKEKIAILVISQKLKSEFEMSLKKIRLISFDDAASFSNERSHHRLILIIELKNLSEGLRFPTVMATIAVARLPKTSRQ